ncbi:MAG: glycoside hydrolase family 2 TIM barrel-domain containing protein [Methylotenera sp.]|uniref:glycoside hydrolase family 2 protein n=1 Tax=Methylotenera sp. TaxID=2051956 RepID=UPI002486EDF7|nr:glycoside hydrolase family 2 TIM barrel-domain containing protein [Methylotenera sp.]MDI1310344.1 glycoside hydrolase family 2 TIM barrel-domain containing protein [Methylotenera sp.]
MTAYPRPQLVRKQWTSLNGQWQFLFDDAGVYKQPDEIALWPLHIEVPFPPESQASGIGDRNFHRACWYQREFDMSINDDKKNKAEPKGGCQHHILLHFGAVDYHATVWVNGLLVAKHEGGHTPFTADITFALNASGKQVVTVMAEDDPHDLSKPRGKQDWQLEPHSIWYPRTTGIWQTVWLERVAETYIKTIRWTPHMEEFSLQFEATLSNICYEELWLEITLRHGERILASDSYRILDEQIDRRIILSDPGIDDFRNELLWSPERPTLLDAEITLRNGTQILDQFTSYTALRSVNILRDRFMLNGRPYMLRMVLDQGYWPDTLLAAPNDDALRRDVELAKAMGFNGVRKHQKIEDPRYLYWADKLGLLVWEEMPSAYRFTRTAITRTVREWGEVIERDYSHPCIIVWVPFNESWGVPELTSIREHRHAVEALYHLTRTLDSTRPVIGNDGWESSATDIIGIHDYDANADQLRNRYCVEANMGLLFDRRRPGGRILTLDGYPHKGQPIMLTEFGGIAYAKCPQPGVSQTWGYSSAKDDTDFLALYRSLMEVITSASLFSGFCYTQFADTFQEANGLLCADRTPKIPLEEIAAITRASNMYIGLAV